MPIDAKWSLKYRPYGIHYCGKDPHRHAVAYGELPYVDFFDLGWGGDIAMMRKHLPNTLLNLRLDPVRLNNAIILHYSQITEMAMANKHFLSFAGNLKNNRYLCRIKYNIMTII